MFVVLSFAKVFKINSWSPKTSIISSLLESPKARNKTVPGIFLLRSIRTFKTSFASFSNSNQVPLDGIILPSKTVLPLLSMASAKYAPGERTNWDTITRSAPLIMKVPESVINGKSPINTSCSLISPVPELIKRKVARIGAA